MIRRLFARYDVLMRLRQQLLLKRTFFHVIFIMASLGVLLLGIRFVWGWEAGVRLARVQREVLARGLAPGASVAGRAIPDDENGAVALLEALRRLQVNSQDPFFSLDFRPYQPMRETRSQLDMTRAMAVLDANTECLEWMKRVADRPKAEWDVDMQVPREDFQGLSIYVASVQMRRLLRAEVQVCHSRHDDGGVFRAIGEIVAMGRVMEANPDLFSQLAASLVRADVMQVIERLAPELEFSPDDVTAARDLIAQLNEECPHNAQIVNAFERTTLGTPDAVLKERPSLGEWWLRPLATEATARRIALQLQLMPIAHARNWQEMTGVPLPPAIAPTTLNTVVVSLSDPPIGIMDAMQFYFRSLADSRASAVLLAVRLYQLEHQALPPTMEVLVPEYLSKVPVDPYSADAEPMRFRVDADGATVWSVGENGVDDHGAPPVPLATGPGFGGRYLQLDIVYGAGARMIFPRLGASTTASGPASSR